MKKALALSVDRHFSTTLSYELETFACHTRAYADYIKNLGYELFVHNPYKAKYKGRKIDFVDADHIVDNAWIEANGLNGFDLIFTRIEQTLIKNVTGDMNWSISDATKITCKALESYTGNPIRNLCVDYRDKLMSPKSGGAVWNVRKPERCSWEEYNTLKNAFDSGKIVACLTEELPSVLSELYTHPEMVVDRGWYNFVGKNIRPSLFVDKYNTDNKIYDYIYVGSYKPGPARAEALNRLVGSLNCKTFGKVKIKGWDSLTNYKNIMDGQVIKNTLSQSKITLAVADSWHNFVTLRFYEGMISGNVLLVDSKFTAAANMAREIGLRDRIVETQKDVINVLNNKNLEELYSDQVKIFKDKILNV